MKYLSVNKESEPVTLKSAVFRNIAEDGGLYMPVTLPRMPDSFFRELPGKEIRDTAFEVISRFLKAEVPVSVIKEITREVFDFPVPLVQIYDNVYTLELFHGPTMAFKDFGARFMSRLMEYFNRGGRSVMKVIVATSGDTGSAVAAGFSGIPGVEVYVLFPRGRVSPLQQKQITTWGGNINAISIEGSFDDCQKLARRALADSDLNKGFTITSANSINLARLIPQSVYYFHAVAGLGEGGGAPCFSVPCGNLGNITAGMMAGKMGLRTGRFIAATNSNDTLPEYCRTASFSPRKPVSTISNAMDVGDPSNFPRLLQLSGNEHKVFCNAVWSSSFTDKQTLDAIIRVRDDTGYIMDPHGAVAFLGLEKYLKESGRGEVGIFLETAHPAKFTESLKGIADRIEMPPQLQMVIGREEKFTVLDNDWGSLKDYLMGST